jgi:hypothetical protein
MRRSIQHLTRMNAYGRRTTVSDGEHAIESDRLGDTSDTSTLLVTYPNGTTRELKHSDALFGLSPYGASTQQTRLYYPNASRTNTTGCDADGLAGDSGIPIGSIVMLERGGGCSFTVKALAAQRAGASGALIVDTHALCGVSASFARGGREGPRGSPRVCMQLHRFNVIVKIAGARGPLIAATAAGTAAARP